MTPTFSVFDKNQRDDKARFCGPQLIYTCDIIMAKSIGILLVCFVCLTFPTLAKSLDYPVVYRNESVIDDFHGTLVSDPYRWLEDPLSQETKAFIEVENNLTNAYVQACPARDAIREKLTAMWNYRKVTAPSKHGANYIYYANSGLLNQDILYKKSSLDGSPEVFLDPNGLSENGTISIYPLTETFSHDGKLFAYGLSNSGSDWMRIHFKDVDTGRDLADVLLKAKATELAWDGRNEGIFYGAYPHLEEGNPGIADNQKILYHKLGTSQDEDVLVAEFPDHPQWILGISIKVSADGRFLFIHPQTGTENAIFFANIPENITGKLEWVPIIPEMHSQSTFISASGSIAYFQTNRNAENVRIIAVNLTNPDESQWTTLVSEHERNVITWAAVADRDKLIVSYMKDVKSTITLRNLTDGSILVEDYPVEVGTVNYWDVSNQEQNEPVFFFRMESFFLPTRIYMLNFTNDITRVEIYDDVTVEGLDANDFETNQVFYPSKDGTQVPMFIVHKKGLELNGGSFSLLYAYGGFAIPSQPIFSVPWAVFMQSFDGVVAVANIRGGGEYGTPWHEAGRLEKRQNAFDDFQAAGEYLIQMNYTQKSKLIIQGSSNGGLLMGASLNQRPDLFAAVLPDVGVLDMLRYHLFTIAYHWIPEYGSAENPTQFEFIYKYSPLHNIRIPSDNTTQYPAVLVTTSLQDDRVVPAHSLKFAAELQYQIGTHYGQQVNPLLIRIEDGAGHGSGKPIFKKIEEQVDIFSFLVQSIGLELTR